MKVSSLLVELRQRGMSPLSEKEIKLFAKEAWQTICVASSDVRIEKTNEGIWKVSISRLPRLRKLQDLQEVEVEM